MFITGHDRFQLHLIRIGVKSKTNYSLSNDWDIDRVT